MLKSQEKTKKRLDRIIEIGIDPLQQKRDDCQIKLIALVEGARGKPYSESQLFLSMDNSLIDIIKANSNIKNMLDEQNQLQDVQDLLFDTTLSAWSTLTGSNELNERYQPHEEPGLGKRALQWFGSLAQKPATSQSEAPTSRRVEYTAETFTPIETYIKQLQDNQNELQIRFQFLQNHISDIAPETLEKSVWLQNQIKLRTQFNQFTHLVQFLDFEDFEKKEVRILIDKLLAFIPAFFNELSQSALPFKKSRLRELEKTLLNHLGQDSSYIDKGIRYLKPDYKHQPASWDTIISLLDNILPIEEPEKIGLKETKQYVYAINQLDKLESILAPLQTLKDILVLQRTDIAQLEQLANQHEDKKIELKQQENELNELATLLEGEPDIEQDIFEIHSKIQTIRCELDKFWKDYTAHRNNAHLTEDVKQRLDTLTDEHHNFTDRLKKISAENHQSSLYNNTPSASSASTHYDDQPIEEPSVDKRLQTLRIHYTNQRLSIISHFKMVKEQTEALQVIVKSRDADLTRLDNQLSILNDFHGSLKEIKESLESHYLFMNAHVQACRKKIHNQFEPQHNTQKNILRALGRPLNEELPDSFACTDSDPILDNDESISQLFSRENPFKLEFTRSYQNTKRSIIEINELLMEATVCKPLTLLGINKDIPIIQEENKNQLNDCLRVDRLARIMEDRLQTEAYKESLKIIDKIYDEFIRILTIDHTDARLSLLLRLRNDFVNVNRCYISHELKTEEGIEVPVMNDTEYVAALREKVTNLIYSPDRERLSDDARAEFSQWFRSHVFKPVQALWIQFTHLFGSSRDTMFFVTAGACSTERELVSTAIEIANSLPIAAA